MWHQYFLLLVGLSLAIANPITRQVGKSEHVGVVVINNATDCIKDEVVYLNGERLDDPSNPCETCHCIGGEVICSVIRCQWREDCEGKYTSGRCCPSYDHCPTLDPVEASVEQQTELNPEVSEAEDIIPETDDTHGTSVVAEASHSQENTKNVPKPSTAEAVNEEKQGVNAEPSVADQDSESSQVEQHSETVVEEKPTIIAESSVAEEIREGEQQSTAVPEASQAEENPQGTKGNTVSSEVPITPEASVVEEETDVNPTSPQVEEIPEASEVEQQTELTPEAEEQTEKIPEAILAEKLTETKQSENIPEASESQTDSPNDSERQAEESGTLTPVEALETETQSPVEQTEEIIEANEEETVSPIEAAEEVTEQPVKESIIAKNKPILTFQDDVRPANLENSAFHAQFGGFNDNSESEDTTANPEASIAETSPISENEEIEANEAHTEAQPEALEAEVQTNAPEAAEVIKNVEVQDEELVEAAEAQTDNTIEAAEAQTEGNIEASEFHTEANIEAAESQTEETESVDTSVARNEALLDETEVETEAPVEASEAVTEAPVEASEADTEAPVEASEVDTEAPVEASETESQATVEASEAETAAPVEASVEALEAITEVSVEASEAVTNAAETEANIEAAEALTDTSSDKKEVADVIAEAPEEAQPHAENNKEEVATESFLMFHESSKISNPDETIKSSDPNVEGTVKVSVNGNDFVEIKETTNEPDEAGVDFVTEAANAIQPSKTDGDLTQEEIYWLMMNRDREEANKNPAVENVKAEEGAADNVQKELEKVAEKYGLKTTVISKPAEEVPQENSPVSANSQATKSEQRFEFNELRRKRGFIDRVTQYVSHFF